MEEADVLTASPLLYRANQGIEDRLGAGRIVSAQSLRDAPRILEKSGCLRVFVCRNELPLAVDGLAIFFNGNTYDAREAFGDFSWALARGRENRQRQRGETC